MKKRILCWLLVMMLAAAASWAEEGAKKTYKIGDIGPGGGIIFYVNKSGFNVFELDGTFRTCNYLEASDVICSSISWCCFKYERYRDSSNRDDYCCGDISTSTDIGYGKINTSKIINANHRHGNINTSNCAAMLCNKYVTPTTKEGDWWLPSKDELELIYINLQCKGYIQDNGSFWSSSETHIDSSWAQNFNYGYDKQYVGTLKHSKKCSVRAVRAF